MLSNNVCARSFDKMEDDECDDDGLRVEGKVVGGVRQAWPDWHLLKRVNAATPPYGCACVGSTKIFLGGQRKY